MYMHIIYHINIGISHITASWIVIASWAADAAASAKASRIVDYECSGGAVYNRGSANCLHFIVLAVVSKIHFFFFRHWPHVLKP